ncbi:MAG: hypothetical protein Q8938_17430 [Bacteroidota bacterium]|nr:hypothetical protein [Bacteroidota bacterium]MDP4260685.1 hypothetical protein [Bacteroidota bacterium]
MRKSTLSTAAIALVACLTLEPPGAFAQTDSTWLDAGTVKLKKNFTQSISIKGEDLEKLPFTNLSEAINVWAFGAYTGPATLLYVVDGMAQIDVNAYSIHDIAEVVFVQNALVQINGVAQQQQLVLISTRKKDPGGKGLTFADQTSLVRADPNHGFPGRHEGSSTGFYQQYFAGINKQVQNMQYGLSADWLHDPVPSALLDSSHIITPSHLNRLRLQGYADIQVDPKNEIVFRMGYVTQDMPAAESYGSGSSLISSSSSFHQNLVMPSIAWTGNLGGGWKNALQLSYVSTSEHGDGNVAGPSVGEFKLTASQHEEHWLVRDHISFSARAGGWEITPALNLSVEHAEESFSSTEFSVSGGGLGGGQSVSSEQARVSGTGLLLTPSLDASYRNAFDIQGGLLFNPSGNTTNFRVKRVFPFASVSTDLLAWRAGGDGHDDVRRSSLKLFGSLALSPSYRTMDYALADYASSQGILLYPSSTISAGPGLDFTSGLPGGTGGIAVPDNLWNWGAGASFSTPADRLQANYHIERNDFPISLYIMYPIYHFEYLRTITHRLGLMWKVAEDKGLHWQSGVNLTAITGTTDRPDTLNYAGNYKGNFNGTPMSWTGGWVNRFEVNDLSFGLDLLYHFNETDHYFVLNPTGGAPSTTNALVLQSLYIGYHVHLPSTRKLEVYLNGRDLWESKWSDLTDRRRFYGFGAKLGI